MVKQPTQLTLGVRLDDAATFENFCTIDELNHQQVMAFLQGFVAIASDRAEPWSDVTGRLGFGYLWGMDAGVSHLLQACCNLAMAQGMTAQYVPLAEFSGEPLALLLEGLEQLDMICLDNLEQVAENPQWELALFDFYNRCKEQGTRLLVGASCAPRSLAIQLPDLISRLMAGAVFHLVSPNDQQKTELLHYRAERLGMSMGAEAARFLLNRHERRLVSLMATLVKLDRASLEHQRKITIPFIKQLANDGFI